VPKYYSKATLFSKALRLKQNDSHHIKDYSRNTIKITVCKGIRLTKTEWILTAKRQEKDDTSREQQYHLELLNKEGNSNAYTQRLLKSSQHIVQNCKLSHYEKHCLLKKRLTVVRKI
jgi:hypothetical protein